MQKRKLVCQLKNIRLKKCLTQKDVVCLCGVSRTIISELENHERSISQEILERFLNGLEIELSEFYKFE